jgi:hypothetical protein
MIRFVPIRTGRFDERRRRLSRNRRIGASLSLPSMAGAGRQAMRRAVWYLVAALIGALLSTVVMVSPAVAAVAI